MSELKEMMEQIKASFMENENLKIANAVMMTINAIRSGARDDEIFYRMKNIKPDEDAYAVVTAMHDEAMKGE